MPQCCNYQFSLWRMVPNCDRNSQISACFSLIIIFQCPKKNTFLILSLPQEPGHTLLWFLSYSYSSLIFLSVLLQRSWPRADTWSILRAAPLNINSFYLSLVERWHSEVEVAYNMKENPMGFRILLSRVSRRTWSEELTVLQTHTHTQYSLATHVLQLIQICWNNHGFVGKHQAPRSDSTGERASRSIEENQQKNLPKTILKHIFIIV